MRPKEDLLAGAIGARFHADHSRGLVKELDILVDLHFEYFGVAVASREVKSQQGY